MLGLDTLDDVQKSVNSDKSALENQAVGQRQSLLSPDELQRLEADIQERLDLLENNRNNYRRKKKKLKRASKPNTAWKKKNSASRTKKGRITIP